MSIGYNGHVRARRTTRTQFAGERPLHEPDILMVDAFNAARTSSTIMPERRLMVAVLEDAWLVWTGAIRAYSAQSLIQRRRERDWILSDDVSWPFSFVNICEALGLEVDRVRGRMLSMEPREGECVPASARAHVVRNMSDRVATPRARTGGQRGRERTTSLSTRGFGGGASV